MRHMPITARGREPARHARLFELIRQENLAAERAAATRDRVPDGAVSDFLMKAARASLQPTRPDRTGPEPKLHQL